MFHKFPPKTSSVDDDATLNGGAVVEAHGGAVDIHHTLLEERRVSFDTRVEQAPLQPFPIHAAVGPLENVTLQRPYGRVDRKRLKRRLVDTCIKGDATLLTKRAVDVEGTAVEFDDGSSVRACVVVDATGFRRKFVRHDVAFDPGFQVTYGALLRVEKHPFPLDKLVLMDYRDEYIGEDNDMRKRNERFPTFMYVMPISDTEIFFEETVLVSLSLIHI